MMEKEPSTQSKYEKTRNDIIDKALKLVDKEGLARLTVRNLALRLKKTPTAVYKYFKSKDDLIDHLRKAQLAKVLPLMQDRISGAVSGREKLISLSLGYIEYAKSHPHLYQLSFNTKVEPVGIDEIMHMQGFRDLLALITECVESGEIILPQHYSIKSYTFHSWITLHGMAMLTISVQNSPESGFAALSGEILRNFYQIGPRDQE